MPHTTRAVRTGREPNRVNAGHEWWTHMHVGGFVLGCQGKRLEFTDQV